MLLRAASRYSGTTPSTIVTLAVPRIDNALTSSGLPPPSMASETTSGGAAGGEATV